MNAKRIKSLLFGMVLSLALPAQAIQPQIVNDPQNPLQIVSAEVPAAGGASRLMFRNDGDSRIVAYVIGTQFLLNNGKTVRGESIADYNGLGLKEQASLGAPPHSKFEPRISSSFTPPGGATIVGGEIRILYVETENGKVFGPEIARFQKTLDERRKARRAERARLLHVYEQGGLPALLEELKK